MTIVQPATTIAAVRRFDGFLLGTAAAAYQIEGAAHEDGHHRSGTPSAGCPAR